MNGLRACLNGLRIKHLTNLISGMTLRTRYRLSRTKGVLILAQRMLRSVWSNTFTDGRLAVTTIFTPVCVLQCAQASRLDGGQGCLYPQHIQSDAALWCASGNGVAV